MSALHVLYWLWLRGDIDLDWFEVILLNPFLPCGIHHHYWELYRNIYILKIQSFSRASLCEEEGN